VNNGSGQDATKIRFPVVLLEPSIMAHNVYEAGTSECVGLIL
jgi:hypothetical protein